MITSYLSRHAFREQLIESDPNTDLGLIVVIPAHDEESLITTLSSLQNCTSPVKKVEVIVVFNASERASEDVIQRNRTAQQEAENYYQQLANPVYRLFCIEENGLPHKHAGVGLARKIGMDEAARRFQKVNNREGVLVCFDADSQCEPNYLIEIEKHFANHNGACSIHFEHPLAGEEFTNEIYQGIYNYELHLRYYKNAMQYADLPYAFHTIGSSMAVNVESYCKEGGMNRRKAGEDFYFLQKFIDVGSLSELKTTKVIPSPRASHRVPFGTGRAIQEMLDDEREIEKTYTFECFQLIKELFKDLPSWYSNEPQFHEMLVKCYGRDFLTTKLAEIRKQSTTTERFVKRFYQWFNAFQCLKFVHFLRDNAFPNQLLTTEVDQLLLHFPENVEGENQLENLRKLDLA